MGKHPWVGKSALQLAISSAPHQQLRIAVADHLEELAGTLPPQHRRLLAVVEDHDLAAADLALVGRLDPRGAFGNDWLDRFVLGAR